MAYNLAYIIQPGEAIHKYAKYIFKFTNFIFLSFFKIINSMENAANLLLCQTDGVEYCDLIREGAPLTIQYAG